MLKLFLRQRQHHDSILLDRDAPVTVLESSLLPSIKEHPVGHGTVTVQECQ